MHKLHFLLIYLVTVAGVRTKIDISGRQDVSSNSVQALSGRYVTVLMNNGDNVPLNLKEVRAYGKAGRRFGLYVRLQTAVICRLKKTTSISDFFLVAALALLRSKEEDRIFVRISEA